MLTFSVKFLQSCKRSCHVFILFWWFFVGYLSCERT